MFGVSYSVILLEDISVDKYANFPCNTTIQYIATQLTYLLTYLLTPYNIVLLEKLTGSAASQEIPRIFGTRRFITVPTSARHLSLSRVNSIQSPQLPLPEDPS